MVTWANLGVGGKSTKKLRVDHVREQLFLFSPPKQQTLQPPIALFALLQRSHSLSNSLYGTG